MNTPTTRLTRPRHVPTPKMSERKKDLFGNSSRSSLINLVIDEDSDLGPMNPLEYSSSPKSYDRPTEPLVNKRVCGRLDFSNLMEQLSPAIKNSCRISQSENSPKRITRSTPSTKLNTEDMIADDIVLSKENSSEVLLKTPALGNSVTTAPRISFRKAQNTSDCSNGTDSPKSRKTSQRRGAEKSDASDTPKAKASLTFGEISAQSFYGTSNVEPSVKRTSVERMPVKVTKVREKRAAPSAKSRRSHQRQSVARKPILGSIRKLNHKFKTKKVVKSDPLTKRSQLLDRIEKVLETSNLTSYFKDVQVNSFDKELISGRARNILKESVQSPNKSNSANRFPVDDDSDTEKRFPSDDESDKDEEPEQTKRKFFKSKSRGTENRYQVSKGISATVKRGHGIKLLSPPKKKRKVDAGYDELLSIQKEVQDIVKLLSASDNDPANMETRDENVATDETMSCEMETHECDDGQSCSAECDKYRKLIPYNTTDPAEIKRQETVLNILIENGICHEENFKIFISEYEHRKDEADAILNNLFEISVSTEAEMWIPQEDEATADDQMQCTSTDASECNAVSNEKRGYHPIFYSDHRRSTAVKKDLLSVPLPKTYKWIPLSDKQLQIDAGQKEFGSKNCSECGMFYTMHDPEDEILHQKFHNNMMGVLNFKGWTDENLVESVDEWGHKGRIIWTNKMDSKAHVTRISEILEIMNNDLGFANVELRDSSIVYLAISRKLVVGVCVAEPLKKAHTMYTKDNVEYIDLKNVVPVRCGISRIWVTPQFRRCGVGTRLIHAIRSHFVRGYTMSSNEMAFSTPTVMGKQFAQTITPNVLVYDQV
ncbi:N-acetyltransferase eco [Bradysia coprophila]|uniref:N-acetyltransferase eco n=1 Tax=Bradysia coprophila TaxID=38358 RepID=UPI00187DC575|nr:N-acetyltransferase eco [Bradysia coprophila]